MKVFRKINCVVDDCVVYRTIEILKMKWKQCRCTNAHVTIRKHKRRIKAI